MDTQTSTWPTSPRAASLTTESRAASTPLRELGGWVRAGLLLWRRAPFKLAVIAAIPFVVEALLQCIPVAGVLLSKWLTPIVMAGQYVAVERLARGGRPRFADLAVGLRRGARFPLFTLGVLLSVIFATQLGVACAVYGRSALDLVLLGHIQAHREMLTVPFEIVLMLPGLVPATLLLFATPLVVLGRVPPLTAVVLSVRRVVATPGVFSLYLLTATLTLVAGVVIPLAGLVELVLSSTLFLTTSFVAYEACFGATPCSGR